MKKSLLALAVATVAVSANAAKLAEVADELEYQTQFIRQNSEAIIQTQKATTAALKASSANTKAIHRLDRDKKRADAGTAAVAAMANIPQVYLSGKSGVGVGVGEKQIDLCKECTCKLNHFLSSPDVTETSTTRG